MPRIDGAFAGFPLIAHVGEDSADEADHRGLVREDADYSGPPFDFLIHPFQRGSWTTPSASGCAGSR